MQFLEFGLRDGQSGGRTQRAPRRQGDHRILGHGQGLDFRSRCSRGPETDVVLVQSDDVRLVAGPITLGIENLEPYADAGTRCPPQTCSRSDDATGFVRCAKDSSPLDIPEQDGVVSAHTLGQGGKALLGGCVRAPYAARLHDADRHVVRTRTGAIDERSLGQLRLRRLQYAAFPGARRTGNEGDPTAPARRGQCFQQPLGSAGEVVSVVEPLHGCILRGRRIRHRWPVHMLNRRTGRLASYCSVHPAAPARFHPPR